MKHYMVLLTAVLVSMTSQANTKTTVSLTLTEATTTMVESASTATKKDQVHGSKKRIPRYKILRSNPHKIVHRIIDNSDDTVIEDDDLISSYRRRDLNKIDHPEGISDDVSWKLFLARQLALVKYREKFGKIATSF